MIDLISKDLWGNNSIELFPLYDEKDHMVLSQSYFIKNDLNYNIDYFRKDEIIRLLSSYVAFRKIQMEIYIQEKELLIFKNLKSKVKKLNLIEVGPKFYKKVIQLIPEFFAILPKEEKAKLRDWVRFQNIEKYCNKRLKSVKNFN